MKAAIDDVRQVYGNSFLGFYVATVSNFAEAPHLILGSRGNVERLVMIYFSVSGVVWLIAAEFHDVVMMDISNFEII